MRTEKATHGNILPGPRRPYPPGALTAASVLFIPP